jgi:hypothetical protein
MYGSTITDKEMNSIRNEEYETFVDRDKSLLCLNNEIINRRTIRLELWKIYSKILSPKDIVELIHLTSQYMLFAVMNNAFQVEVEPDIDALPGVYDNFSPGNLYINIHAKDVTYYFTYQVTSFLILQILQIS